MAGNPAVAGVMVRVVGLAAAILSQREQGCRLGARMRYNSPKGATANRSSAKGGLALYSLHHLSSPRLYCLLRASGARMTIYLATARVRGAAL